jgi:glutaredoxin
VITKAGCHICESAIQDLIELKKRYGFELETLDILKDASLFDKYWIKIPVVRLDGKDVYEVEEIARPKERLEKFELLFRRERSNSNPT